MTGPAAERLRCCYCGAELTVHWYKEEHWYTDEDGVMVCPVASTVVYLGHEPLPTARTRTAAVL